MPGFDIQQMAGGVKYYCQPLFGGFEKTAAVEKTGGPGNATETTRRYRYSFTVLEPLDKESLLLYAYKTTRPSLEIDQITIHNGQDEIYRPGKSRWKPIEITFYERLFGETDLGASTGGGYDQPAELIYKWWAKTMINVDQSLHNAPTSYRKPCELAMLDGLGIPVWKYYLSNCWIMNVNPCDLSYTDTEIADITITLSYDKAIEQRGVL